MGRRSKFVLAAALFACALCACGPAQHPLSQPETITVTVGGARLAATLYPVAAKNPPGLVLVHSLGGNRADWDFFARRAAAAGYVCLSFDMRGHGDSVPPPEMPASHRNFTTDHWLAVLDDIDACMAVLVRNGADPDNLAVVGASIGANLTLHFGIRQPQAQALVLLSPGRDYRGVPAASAQMNALGVRPVLIMVSNGDEYSAASAAELKQAAPGFCEIRAYNGTAHGIDLLAVNPAAIDQIFLWLKAIIGPEEAAGG